MFKTKSENQFMQRPREKLRRVLRQEKGTRQRERDQESLMDISTQNKVHIKCPDGFIDTSLIPPTRGRLLWAPTAMNIEL